MEFTLVLGTARKGRVTENVASFIQEKISRINAITLNFVDVNDYLLGKTTPPDEENAIADKWRKIAFESDAFIFVVPEYNHGYPGEFKILLDSAEAEYLKKPALLITVSNGPWGGARMSENIKPVLQNLGLILIPKVLHTSYADKKFENGMISDEVYQKQLDGFLKELVEYATGLKSIRGI